MGYFLLVYKTLFSKITVTKLITQFNQNDLKQLRGLVFPERFLALLMSHFTDIIKELKVIVRH